MSNEEVEYKSGLTWRSISGLVYATAIFMPATLFSMLTIGIAVPYVHFIVILLLTEVVGRVRRLTKQEVLILYSAAGIASGGSLGFIILQQIYWRSLATVTWAFREPATDLPLPQVIPDWYAPPPFSTGVLERNLFAPEILYPLGVLVVAWLFASLMHISLAYLMYGIYGRRDAPMELPFPMAEVGANAVTSLAELPPEKISVISMAGLGAAVYATMLYIIPALGLPSALPIPFADFTTIIEKSLPGGSLGIATDLFYFALGFIMPFSAVISLFAASLGIYLVGNPILVSQGLFEEWSPGMGAFLLFQRSILRFWVFPMIGFTFTVALLPFAFRIKRLLAVGRSMFAGTSARGGEGLVSFKIVGLLYVVGASGLLGLNILLTDFSPLLLAAMIFGFGLMMTLISTVALGETGVAAQFPYAQNVVIYASGYMSADIWFAPLFALGGGAGFVGLFRIADMTKTRIRDIIVAILIGSGLAWTLSIPMAAILWRISPIPSTLYRAVDIFWPVQIIQQSIWITRAIDLAVRLPWILGGTVAGVVIVILEQLLHIPLISAYGALAGISTPLPFALSYLIGGIFGYGMKLKMTKWWAEHKVDLAVGIFLGESVVLALAVALEMITRGLWVIPY